jgi:sec-independent protein translocase protein TatC
MTRDAREMGFWEHIEELRRRLITTLATILGLSIISYFFADYLIEAVTHPIEEVFFMGPTEAFAVRIKISLFAGVILGLPVLIYQMWQFVVPGLYDSEVRVVVPVVIFATLFFIGGAAFCFFLVMPVGIKFLLGFGTEKMKPLIAVGKYVSFVGWMTMSFGVVFQLPIISFFLGRLGILSSAMMRRGRRYAIVGILFTAAAVTPSPDVFSQLMLAGPLYLLYEASVLLVRLTGRREEHKPAIGYDAAEDDSATDD